MATTQATQPQEQTINLGADPNQAEIDSFNEDVSNIINEISNEWESQGLSDLQEKPQGESETVTDEQPTEPEVETAGGDEPKEENPEREDPAIKRGLDRLVAREVEIQAKEAKANALIAQAQQMMEKAKAYDGLKPVAELKEIVQHSPSEVLKHLGVDPQDAVKLILAEQLGEKAPQELKDFAKDASYRRRMAELERRLQEKEASEKAINYFNVVSAGAREYVKQVGDSTPTVKAVAAVNPDMVHQEILEELRKDAQARVAQDPNADLMTYDEAVKRVEARWSAFRSVIQKNEPGTTNGKPKTTTPPVKPPTKPLAPWKAPSGKELEQRGIDEAIKEFARVESQRKRF